MMHALVALSEGNRVVAVVSEPFPVAPGLLWVECGDDVVAESKYEDAVFVPPPKNDSAPGALVTDVEEM
jgi:hypothetical protein